MKVPSPPPQGLNLSNIALVILLMKAKLPMKAELGKMPSPTADMMAKLIVGAENAFMSFCL